MTDRTAEEISFCFLYEPEKEAICRGANGRKMREVCVWCQNYKRFRKQKERSDEKCPK